MGKVIFFVKGFFLLIEVPVKVLEAVEVRQKLLFSNTCQPFPFFVKTKFLKKKLCLKTSSVALRTYQNTFLC